ncbi:hypothetical protein LR48_Vigan09g120400 [Vigna angularis]|uniref:Uncharacterized protein n=1 Tax=Phaseolus angularis TaxID=3914 RepID=A0A0L9VBV7_PHAAN|nr:hypothetical protein LR48_Vigan09g120400 [Vigna angularis]
MQARNKRHLLPVVDVIAAAVQHHPHHHPLQRLTMISSRQMNNMRNLHYIFSIVKYWEANIWKTTLLPRISQSVLQQHVYFGYRGRVVDEWKEQYDSVTARKLVCRDDADRQCRILAGKMKVQPRILHYVLTRVLIPRATNIGQASEEDIMLLWALFNSIHINWGHVIRYRMKRALKDKAKLSYPHLITIFIEHFQVPTDTDPITNIKFKQKMGYEVVASFGYVQNDDGEWVPTPPQRTTSRPTTRG